MGPAGERLEARDLARFQVDQRLVKQLQLVLLERPAKLGLDREAAPRQARLLGLVDLRLAGLLGLLDRELGVAEQLLGVLAGVHQRDPDRAFDADLEVGQLERRRHHLLDSLGRLQGVLDAAAQRHQHAEFVAPGAGQHVAAAQGQDQATSERDQQLVPGEAAHRFVDPAEAQHVDDQHGVLEVARDLVAGLLDGFGEGQPVGQPGQAVAQHLGAQRALGLHLDGPVDDAEQAARSGALGRAAAAPA